MVILTYKFATMESPVKAKQKDISRNFNRVLYAAFVVLGLYFLIFSKDKSQGVINMGIALAFDPFDQKQPFKERPLYQKCWLVLHLAVVLGLFVFTMTR